jgi:hypothetical protein
VRYLGIAVDDALEISGQTEIRAAGRSSGDGSKHPQPRSFRSSARRSGRRRGFDPMSASWRASEFAISAMIRYS